MKNILTLLLFLLAPALQAQTKCPAADPNRLAAVLTGSAAGHASFVIEPDRGVLSYRIDAGRLPAVSGARIQRAGADVLDLIPNDESFVDGVLEGTISPPAALLEQLLADPAAFSLEVTAESGTMRGALNGRGGVLMAGTLAMNGGTSQAKVRPNVASNATGIFTLGFVDYDPSGDDVRVDFDIMTDSIAGFDTASVVLVGDGFSEDILDLVSVRGFTGGRLHGDVRLSREELERIVANPSGYHVQFRSPDDGLFGGAMSEAVTTFIPAFGRARNATGQQLSSDLRLYNPGSRAENVFIQFFPAGATEPLAGHTAIIRLEPGHSRVVDNALSTLFGSSAGMGALRVVSGARVVADSEIGDGVRNLGQFISGIDGCSALTDGVLASLSASRSANGFRTNVLIGNPGARPAVAHFELRDGQGRLLDSTTMRLPAHAQSLLPLTGANGGLFRNAPAELRNAVLTMHADTPLFLGSSLVHNGTGEARFNAARSID